MMVDGHPQALVLNCDSRGLSEALQRPAGLHYTRGQIVDMRACLDSLARSDIAAADCRLGSISTAFRDLTVARS